MNKLLYLLLVAITFVSCDGRQRKHKTNTEVLVENKLLDSFSEKTSFFPETYAEVITDTILSNGYSVRIKTYTNMQNNVLKTFNKNTITYKHFYRTLVSEISVTKNNHIVFKKNIDTTYFEQSSPNNKTYKNHITNSIYIDQLKSIESNKVVLVASLAVPNAKNEDLFNIVIDENGVFKIIKKNYVRT